MEVEYVRRSLSELIHKDTDNPSGPVNVNVCNLREFIPFDLVREPGEDSTFTMTFHKPMFEALVPDNESADLLSFMETHVKSTVDAHASSGPDNIDVDALIGWDTTDSCDGAPEPQAAEEDEPEAYRRTVRLCLEVDWQYPNARYPDLPSTDPAFDQELVDLFGAVYEWFLSRYDYSNWCSRLRLSDLGIFPQAVDGAASNVDLPLTSLLLPVREMDTASLLAVARGRVISGSKLRDDVGDEFSSGFIQAIEHAIDELMTTCECSGVFAKLAAKSAKNDTKLRPLRTVVDVLNTITGSKDILGWLNHERTATTLVLLPWNPRIESNRNEYRAFMLKGSLTAVSQQAWYYCNETPLDPPRVVAAIAALAESLLPRLPFSTSTLDVWIDATAPDGVYRAYLIECNPWGGFFSSGSSLFHWGTHWKCMHDPSIVTFATLSL